MVAALPPAPLPLERSSAMLVREHELEIASFRVHISEGPDRGREVESEGTELSIGTAEANQLVLSDPSVARHHCVITATPEGFVLRDLGTPGGTLLGGYRVREAMLTPGAVIGIGRTKLSFDTVGRMLRLPLARTGRFGKAIGESAAMRRVFGQLEKLAAGEQPVLLLGESGTGKSLVAEAIHTASPRARGPFVAVDCGSLPPSLVEVTLFGQEKGAPGKLEAARGGTLFLDDIGELSPDLQQKLLRVLEKGVSRRVGSLEPLPVDVRIVAATSRDLRQEVNRSTFRADLFYRLSGATATLPPLRERREDIAALVASFWSELAGRNAGPPAHVLGALARQEWPGNLRQLRTAVERAVAAEGVVENASARATTVPDLSLVSSLAGGIPVAPPARVGPPPMAEGSFDPTQSFRASKEAVVTRWERAYLVDLVRHCRGNVSRAARAARMDRNHLRDLLRRHGIDANEIDE
jgi:two-component system response regulator GlrR